MTTLLLIAIFAPFVVAPFVAAGGRLGARVGWLALIAPIVSAGAVGLLLAGTESGARTVVELPWIPSLGLNLVLMVDGLSLFFAMVVSGMGVLVFFYATQYLDSHYKFHARFYTYLLLFMGAMLGTVFAGNLLLLFVFWELTSITSFLLIGFLHGKEESRAGARMAILVTGTTALAMLAGIAIVGVSTGTYDLATLLGGEVGAGTRDGMTVAFLLIALGAMGKSAQFPFHFWLPNAMAAPTPVSAYLHSATMVKLGVFLVARVFPLFEGQDLWGPVLVTVAYGTMFLAALLAILSHDLKAILAYSTVSALGSLIGFYGLGGPTGVTVDLMHAMNHVFYKGCLFMVVGIVDHSTGIRDVRRLGGLARSMPLLAVITAIATASMAGLPGTTGFISKEYLLKALYAGTYEVGGWLPWYALICAFGASILKVVFSARIFFGVFMGPVAKDAMEHFHAPGFGLQVSPLILAVGCVMFGLVPGVMDGMFEVLITPGLHAPEPEHYAIWHGITPGLMMSIVILTAGPVLYLFARRGNWAWARIPRPLQFDYAFERGVERLPVWAKGLTQLLRAERPFDYLPVVISFLLVVVGGYAVWQFEALGLDAPSLEDFDPLRSFVVALIALAVLLVLRARRWTAQLIALSIIGFLITFYFVLFQAPDLAMTQILVETATLLLVLLLLARFPRSAEGVGGARMALGGRQVFNVVLSLGVGVLTTGLTVMALSRRPAEMAGEFFLEASVPLAYGTNAVNTILVDFRGTDTLFEVAVLVVAMLGAVGLFMRYRRTPAEYEAGPTGPAGIGLRPRRRDQEDKRS